MTEFIQGVLAGQVVHLFVYLAVVYTKDALEKRKLRKKREAAETKTALAARTVYELVLLLKDGHVSVARHSTREAREEELVLCRNAFLDPNGRLVFANAVFHTGTVVALYGRDRTEPVAKEAA